MSDLSTGNAPSWPVYWGFPSSVYNYCTMAYENGGMIWYGPEPATVDDIVELLTDPRSMSKLDRGTVCGTADPRWSTYQERVKDLPCYSQSYTVG